MDITYQQILAQQYAENDAYYRHDEEEDEDVEEEFQVEGREAEDRGYVLEDREAFREFPGNRNTEALLVKPRSEFDDKGKNSVRYNKDVIRRVFNIDTGFRAYIDPGFGQTVSGDPALTAAENATKADPNALNITTSTATHFVFRTHDIVKNAISVKLSSLEIPNKFFNLFDSRGNTTMNVRKLGEDVAQTIRVDLDPTTGGGYYNNVTIVSEVEQQLNRAFPTGAIDANGNAVNQFSCSRTSANQIIIESVYPPSNPARFEFDFPAKVVSPQLYPTLPQALGFQETFYANATRIVSEDAIDMNADTYIYLQINDWNTVTPQVSNDAYFTVFAKIPVTVDKGRLMYDSDVTNTTTKTYHFLQPTNVQQMEIQLLDRAGNTLQMPQNINFSMTLEVEDVVSKALYEKLREL